MRKIKKAESLREQVYSILKDEILNKDSADEVMLYERKISEELNVSRTPVREALKALEQEGLVEYVPYKGIMVKRLSEPDLKNIFQIRNVLEELAIELAMKNTSAKYIRKLEESVLAQQKLLGEHSATQKKQFMDLDVQFHGLLLEMAENVLLSDMMAEIQDKTRRFGLNAIYNGEYRYAESLDEHIAILEAIQQSDMQGAKVAMSQHMLKTYENAYKYVTSAQQKKAK